MLNYDVSQVLLQCVKNKKSARMSLKVDETDVPTIVMQTGSQNMAQRPNIQEGT